METEQYIWQTIYLATSDLYVTIYKMCPAAVSPPAELAAWRTTPQNTLAMQKRLGRRKAGPSPDNKYSTVFPRTVKSYDLLWYLPNAMLFLIRTPIMTFKLPNVLMQGRSCVVRE